MLEIPTRRSPQDVLADCARRGLVVKELPYTGRDTRRDRKHWHIRRPEGAGTLELTRQGDRVWLTVKPHWDGGWATALARRLAGAALVD
jgi:hypothetical protein